MLRSLPPHLMALIVLLVIVLWLMMLRYFRRSPSLQRFVSDLFGDTTPENALWAFELAKARLANHLLDPDLDQLMRERIELALTGSHPSLPSAPSAPESQS
ncbi:hypothetical protein [Schlesneria sp. DSM 10557]|uniref:hypothetical protein n=1 Tax=Schlesneria sp. DSM 10557 TaxID=3044399 RepID=UPI00359F89DE